MFDATVGTWIGVVIGVIGLVTGYIFYRRSRIYAELAYVASSIQMTGRNAMFPPELKIFYGDKEVDTVTQTNIILWNYGNSTIEGERIVESDPLRIVVSPGGEILTSEVITSRDVLALACKPFPGKPNELEITFDFLDTRDGALIRLTHTGNKKTRVRGTIRGIPEGVKDIGKIPPAVSKGFIRVLFFMFSIPLVIGVILWSVVSDIEFRNTLIQMISSFSVVALVYLLRELWHYLNARKLPTPLLTKLEMDS
ncbi:MAG: hypothetical protein ACJ74T_08890 [Pyrinomonadaceae bacterium]